MQTAQGIPSLSTLNLRSLSPRMARLDHSFQARIRNRFGPTVRFLRQFIPSHAVILDIGANHGKFAKNFARLAGGSCRVLCFEPLEYNYTLLETVVRRYKNVRVFRIALSDKAGADRASGFDEPGRRREDRPKTGSE